MGDEAATASRATRSIEQAGGGRGASLADRVHAWKEGRWAFLPGLAPVLLLYGVLLVLPMLLLGRYSFYRTRRGTAEVIDSFTVDAFVRFFSDAFYLGILLDTMIVGFVVVLICAVLGYPLAYFLAGLRRWKAVFLMIVLAPFFVSQVVKTYGWMVILSNQGFLNWLLIESGLVSERLRMLYNRTGVIVGMVHILIPFMILTLESVIRQIRPQVLDAARSLGAREWQVFFKVILPMSLPGLVAGSLLVFSLAISIFTTPALMGGERVQLMSNFIYKRAVSIIDWPLAAVASWVLLVLALLTVIVCLKVLMPKRMRA
ncbi:MAG: ABC transporter permease [Alphaproteobacteria bacterium]|nr:ABC transporter permease [Alphaproteobacteria bacterium]